MQRNRFTANAVAVDDDDNDVVTSSEKKVTEFYCMQAVVIIIVNLLAQKVNMVPNPTAPHWQY